MHNVIQHCETKNQPLFVAFIDFQKAFDHIVQQCLFMRLANKGIYGQVYRLIMYNSNVSAVKVGSKISKYFKCDAGVWQGDSLSPTLFNTLIGDIINELNN